MSVEVEILRTKLAHLSTTLFDARLVIRAQKKHIAKLEKRYARIRRFRLSKIWRRRK